MIVLVVKRYAVRKARKGWYAVRKGERVVTLITSVLTCIV